MAGADRYQLLPELSPEDFAALKADIAGRGVVVPIVVDADSGEIIDGHHRLRAWSELRAEGAKVGQCPRDVRRFGSEEERVATALSLNLTRRHLERKERSGLVTELRRGGWSLRRIAEIAKVDPETVRRDLAGVASATPAAVTGADGKTYAARRPSIIVATERDQHRAEQALRTLGNEAPPRLLGLNASEERARRAALSSRIPEAPAGPVRGSAYELRVGDLEKAWADLEPGSLDAIVTDPPYTEEGLPTYAILAELATRVLVPGRLCVVYCGHLHLDTELRLLTSAGLCYVWHGVNILPGRQSRIRARMVFGGHRSVVILSAGPYRPRSWIADTVTSESRGGPEALPLHPWQQALGPVRHWVRQVSRPGETIFDPFLGSGTTAAAALLERRSFIGGDSDPSCVETTRQRLAELGDEPTSGAQQGTGDQGTAG
jgi:ParB-like chromosome segregation protein Spo0J